MNNLNARLCCIRSNKYCSRCLSAIAQDILNFFNSIRYLCEIRHYQLPYADLLPYYKVQQVQLPFCAKCGRKALKPLILTISGDIDQAEFKQCINYVIQTDFSKVSDQRVVLEIMQICCSIAVSNLKQSASAVETQDFGCQTSENEQISALSDHIMQNDKISAAGHTSQNDGISNNGHITLQPLQLNDISVPQTPISRHTSAKTRVSSDFDDRSSSSTPFAVSLQNSPFVSQRPENILSPNSIIAFTEGHNLEKPSFQQRQRVQSAQLNNYSEITERTKMQTLGLGKCPPACGIESERKRVQSAAPSNYSTARSSYSAASTTAKRSQLMPQEKLCLSSVFDRADFDSSPSPRHKDNYSYLSNSSRMQLNKSMNMSGPPVIPQNIEKYMEERFSHIVEARYKVPQKDTKIKQLEMDNENLTQQNIMLKKMLEKQGYEMSAEQKIELLQAKVTDLLAKYNQYHGLYFIAAKQVFQARLQKLPDVTPDKGYVRHYIDFYEKEAKLMKNYNFTSFVQHFDLIRRYILQEIAANFVTQQPKMVDTAKRFQRVFTAEYEPYLFNLLKEVSLYQNFEQFASLALVSGYDGTFSFKMNCVFAILAIYGYVSCQIGEKLELSVGT